MNNLIIIGAGGHGKVCLDIALKMNQWNGIYFLDDNADHDTCLGHKIVGSSQDAIKYKDTSDFFVAIGDNKTREKVLTNLIQGEYSIATLIHPQSIINSFVSVGIGTVVMAGTVINSDTKIGIGCILNTNSTIEHDNLIHDYVHISPGVNLAGNVSIGERSWIGIGSTVINNVIITEDVQVGACSNVVQDLAIGGIYIGNPAKQKI